MTTEHEEDVAFWTRVADILEASVDGLAETDRLARIEYCQRTGEHGIRAFDDGDAVEFKWGGRPLAVVDRDVFVPGAEVAGAWIPSAPDDLRELD